MKRLPLIAAALVFPLLAAALVYLPFTAHAQVSEKHGRALAIEFCGACHAIDKSGASPKPEAPPLRAIGQSYDLDGFVDRLQSGVASDHPDMPEVKFSERDARDMRAYLRTIQQ